MFRTTSEKRPATTTPTVSIEARVDDVSVENSIAKATTMTRPRKMG